MADSPLTYIQADFRKILDGLLVGCPEAARQLEKGNAVTAFDLLRDSKAVRLKKGIGVDKEDFLNMAFLQLPTMYRVGDMNPD